MSKTDSFSSNICIEGIIELSVKYPNDMDFGKHTKHIIEGSSSSNECIKAITELLVKYPNDMEFGKHTRFLIEEINASDSIWDWTSIQIRKYTNKNSKDDLNHPDMGEVNDN